MSAAFFVFTCQEFGHKSQAAVKSPRQKHALQTVRWQAGIVNWSLHQHRLNPMPVQQCRPDVADMVLRTYERPIHPELFAATRSCSFSVAGQKATVRLGMRGHSLAFGTSECTLTEVATAKQVDLPEYLKVVHRRLIGYRTHMIDLPGVRYHCSYQLEHVPLDVYLQLHREMEADARNATISLTIPGATPQSPECISLLKCDVLQEGLVVHAFHTFPENAAVLRIQTLFELL